MQWPILGEGEYRECEVELVALSDMLMRRRKIRVGFVEFVGGRTSIGEGVRIGLDKQLGQGHTLWFDLGRFDFGGQYGYTRYRCIRREKKVLIHF